jgi:transcription elongation factor SPT5
MTLYSENASGDICKQDKIRVIKGDLLGTQGAVTFVEREAGFVSFKATNIPSFTDELRIEISSVAKYFEPGDRVRIVDGKHVGETGIVIKIE